MDAEILRSVSRSFYLSIRLLPVRLREPIALAYLLARTTDTIADTAQISGNLRVESLKLLSNAIQGTGSRDGVVDRLASFVSLQENASERELLTCLSHSLSRLEEMDGADRNDIRLVLEKITRGQMLDLQHFDNPQEIRALATAADLNQYTYLVAGSVGEFWTRLCFRHIRDAASRYEDEMLSLGKRYGMALQLVNVLRDAGSDLREGRCYFPAEELREAHLDASEILTEPARFEPLYRRWLRNAEAGLARGMEYSHALKNRRVRAATVLPALIGARTLALLEASGPSALQRTVKIRRVEVRAMILSLALTMASRRKMDAIFNHAKP